MKITKAQIQDISTCDAVSKNRDGNFIAKWSYYYYCGRTPNGYATKVQAAFPTAVIVNLGDHNHSFCGGCKSGSAKDSYMWVEFKLA